MVRAAARVLSLRGGRGLSAAVSAIGRAFPRENHVVVEVVGGRLKVDLQDSYWMAPLLRGDGYEPEIRHVLSRVLRAEDAFVDCGANLGYWSVFASARIRSAARVVAVEGSRSMFDRLAANAQLNANAFTPLHAAIWNESGREVDFAVDDVRHSWASADPSTHRELRKQGFRSERVKTITIDDVVAGYLSEPYRLAVVKVDVEGSELLALDGATEVIGRNALFIYEDHGRDLDSAVSAALLNRGDLALFSCSAGLVVREVKDLAAVERTKAEKERGYNFFMCSPRMPIYESMRDLAE